MWVIDVYSYAWLREFMGGAGVAFATLAGNLFFWIPFFAGGLVHLAVRENDGLFRKTFFFAAGGIVAYQICSLLAWQLSVFSPIVLQHQIVGTGVRIPVDLVFSFPDWGCGSFTAMLSFIMFRGKFRNGIPHGVAVAGFLYFLVQRVGGAYSFLSGGLFGALIGLFVGWMMARLSRRVENPHLA